MGFETLIEVCCVGGEFCTHPDDKGQTPVPSCFVCERRVCLNCSTAVVWYQAGRRRVCHTCLRKTEVGEPIVEHQLNMLAGYSTPRPVHVVKATGPPKPIPRPTFAASIANSLFDGFMRGINYVSRVMADDDHIY